MAKPFLRRARAAQKLISFRRLPKLIGIAASPGVAIGKVHPIDRRRARVPRYHIAADDVPDELERLDHAIRDSVEQLQAIRESLGEGDQGKILDAHRMMADDPSVLDAARSLVREELLNAEWAVRRTFREISEKLGNDGYLAERRADLDEVSDRIIHNLVGEVPATQLEQPPEDSILVAYDLPTAEAAVLLSGGRVKGLVTDLLIGDLFTDRVDAVWGPMESLYGSDKQPIPDWTDEAPPEVVGNKVNELFLPSGRLR